MNNQVFFLNMFPDYEPPEGLKDTLSQAAIVAADIDPETKRVEVAIYAERYMSQRALDDVASDLRSAYGLRAFSITASYPAHQLQCIETDELMALFVAQNSMNRGALAGAKWEWAGETLRIQLLGNGLKQLQEAVPAVCRDLRERFAAPVEIQITAGEALEGKALFEAMERMRGSQMVSRPASAPDLPKKHAAQPESNAFYGKPIKGPVTPMQDVTLDMGSVIIEGRVFAVEHKELKKRNAWVINFDMTDNYGSVRINRFMEANEAKPILENVKVGAVLKVQGKPELNRYDNEMVLKPFAMQPGSMPKRKDTYDGMKRVELHLHTAMSNMDALTSTKAAIKQAAAWGHKAIAITDHGCCNPLRMRCMWWRIGRDHQRLPGPTRRSRFCMAAKDIM